MADSEKEQAIADPKKEVNYSGISYAPAANRDYSKPSWMDYDVFFDSKISNSFFGISPTSKHVQVAFAFLFAVICNSVAYPDHSTRSKG